MTDRAMTTINVSEAVRSSWGWFLALGIAFILGRIAHVFGMDGKPGNRLRTIGILSTALILIGLAAYAISLPYLDAARPASITYAAL